MGQAWWYTPVIPVTWRWRQEDQGPRPVPDKSKTLWKSKKGWRYGLHAREAQGLEFNSQYKCVYICTHMYVRVAHHNGQTLSQVYNALGQATCWVGWGWSGMAPGWAGHGPAQCGAAITAGQLCFMRSCPGTWGMELRKQG
jgi:hypothetical protein